VKHLNSEDWERATLNLPLVEGDELTTAGDSRVEIQFGNYQHLRLDENAYLKIAVLKDEGIAVSLSLGTMNLRLTRFDKDKSYFEIDAPQSTIAIQKAGSYRIDAGQSGESEIRVAVSEGGEARVYSENSGFTLKNNRSARVFISGDDAGEWEPTDSRAANDEFDNWARERDDVIATRLAGAYYDKYYDQDIYCADDLNGYGDWVYIRQYGYVWRPFDTTISSYADWSPYRYGTWRWVPPFGWTWVNDEPWGWATYHHGRWIYHSSRWYWTPYGYYRYSRSWWFPGLVVINVFNNNVCWYPLGYRHRWHNYNAWYNNNHGGHHGGGHPPVGGGPTPHPTAMPTPRIRQNPNTALSDEIPPGGVVTVGTSDFGKIKASVRTAPLTLAKAAIATGSDGDGPVLPAFTPLKTGSDVVVPRPQTDRVAANTKVGAAPRKTDAPMDEGLRNERIRGGRIPVSQPPQGDGTPARDPRQPGVIIRPPVKAPPTTDPPIRQVPPSDPPTRTDPPERPPVKAPPTRTDPPIRQVPPFEPARTKQPPRSEPSPTRQPPRVEPAPVRQPPRSEPAPVRQPPKQTPKSDTPSKTPPAKAGKANNAD
jgi:hypothetical protein